jgi:hypothetical protein
MKSDNNEIARHKFNKAVRLLSEVCGLEGKNNIAVRVCRIDQGQPAAVKILEPSHAPNRHPEKPLPMPPSSSPHHLDPVGFECERCEMLAKKWSEATNHDPAFHHASFCDVQRKILHHPECISNSAGAGFGKCDCGRLFLIRFAGQVFAVNADGSLERFTAPTPSPEKFRADEKAFFVDLAWDVPGWVLPVMADTLEFTTSGDGVTEHFVEEPTITDQ